MKPAVVAAVALAAMACAKPTPPPASVVDAWNALTSAGCLDPDGSSPADLQAQIDAGAPAWLLCMVDGGGFVSTCGVPCDDTATKRR